MFIPIKATGITCGGVGRLIETVSGRERKPEKRGEGIRDKGNESDSESENENRCKSCCQN